MKTKLGTFLVSDFWNSEDKTSTGVDGRPTSKNPLSKKSNKKKALTGQSKALPRVITIRPICIEGNHFRLGPKYSLTQIGHNFSNIDANDLIPSRIERGDTAESIPHTFRPQKVKNGEVLPFSSYGRVGGPKKNWVTDASRIFDAGWELVSARISEGKKPASSCVIGYPGTRLGLSGTALPP